MKLIVKFYSGSDTRRRTFDSETFNYRLLEQTVQSMFNNSANSRKDNRLFYRDEDNDFVRISSDDELNEAFLVRRN